MKFSAVLTIPICLCLAGLSVKAQSPCDPSKYKYSVIKSHNDAENGPNGFNPAYDEYFVSSEITCGNDKGGTADSEKIGPGPNAVGPNVCTDTEAGRARMFSCAQDGTINDYYDQSANKHYPCDPASTQCDKWGTVVACCKDA